jgi:Flp pilus assembly protein TadG
MRRQNDAGQALATVAVTLTVLLLAAGLAVDMGYLRYQKRRMQTAADSAAIAAASQLNDDPSSAAITDANANGFEDTSLGGTASVAIACSTALNPWSSAACDGSDADSGYTPYVQATVSQPQRLFFMTIIPNITQPTVKAIATARMGSGLNCVYGLGPVVPPNTAAIIETVAATKFDASGCGVIDNASLDLSGDAPSHFFGARSIGLTGTCSGSACTTATDPSDPENASGLAPYPPQTIIPTSDPLNYLQPPGPSGLSCSGGATYQPTGGLVAPTSSPVLLTNGIFTVAPGPYSCGIQINDSGGPVNVTFESGLYALACSGTPCYALAITSTSTNFGVDPVTVNGAGVTFYNANGGIQLCVNYSHATPSGIPLFDTGCISNANEPGNEIDLTAPISGDYTGILFYQDRSDTTPASIVGNDAFGVYEEYGSGWTFLEGALYFPSATLNVGDLADVGNAGGAIVWENTYTILVADTVQLSGTVFLGSNYSVLTNGSPIRDAVLVQ